MSQMRTQDTEPSRRVHYGVTAAFLAVALATLAVPARGEMPSPELCGVLSNGNNGPWDYRNERQMLPAGENNHFTAPVESLIRGHTASVGADINFILHMYPNHPRALLAMMRWGEKLKTPKPHDTRYTVECYFERALRFRPNDNVVRMLYAHYLSRNARQPEAEKQLDWVVSAAGDSAFTYYNAGLLYFDINSFDKAAAQARTALALGLRRTDLIDKLKRAGRWSDTDAATPSPAASAASAPAPQ